MSGIARGRIRVANLFQLRSFGMGASFRRRFSRIAVKSQRRAGPKQLEAPQVPAMPPKNVVTRARFERATPSFGDLRAKFYIQ